MQHHCLADDTLPPTGGGRDMRLQPVGLPIFEASDTKSGFHGLDAAYELPFEDPPRVDQILGGGSVGQLPSVQRVPAEKICEHSLFGLLLVLGSLELRENARVRLDDLLYAIRQ